MPLNLIFCTWSTASLRRDVTSSSVLEADTDGLHVVGCVLPGENGGNSRFIGSTREGRLRELAGVLDDEVW